MELVEVKNTEFEWSHLERLYTGAFPAGGVEALYQKLHRERVITLCCR